MVLALLSKGYLYKEIGEKLGIAYNTVHTHVRRVYEKLQVHSRTQAAAFHLAHALANRSGEVADG